MRICKLDAKYPGVVQYSWGRFPIFALALDDWRQNKLWKEVNTAFLSSGWMLRLEGWRYPLPISLFIFFINHILCFVYFFLTWVLIKHSLCEPLEQVRGS